MARRRWPYADADPGTAAGPLLVLLLARTRRRGAKTGETKLAGNDSSSSSGSDDGAYSAAYSYVHSPADDAYELYVYEEEAAYPAAEDAADTHARPPAYPLRGVAAGSRVVPAMAMPPMEFPPPPPPPAVVESEERPDAACRSRAATRAAIRSVPPAVGETRAGMRRGAAAPPVIVVVVVFVFVFVMGRILLVLPVVVMVMVLWICWIPHAFVLCWF